MNLALTRPTSPQQFEPRPRGRPTASESRELEARILSAAMKVFVEHGYGGASIADIAKAAKIARSTFYRRFQSKQQVLHAIADAQLAAWDNNSIDGLLNLHEVGLEQVLGAFGRRLLRAALAPELIEFNRLMHSEAGRFPEIAQAARRRWELGVDRLSRLLSNSGSAALGASVSIDEFARTFLTMLAGVVHVAIMSKRQPRTDQCHAALDAIVRSMTAHALRPPSSHRIASARWQRSDG